MTSDPLENQDLKAQILEDIRRLQTVATRHGEVDVAMIAERSVALLKDPNVFVGRWNEPKNGMPIKPGLKSYEYVDCLIVKNGDVFIRPWNCEHLCFDDESRDDHDCDVSEITAWAHLPTAPEVKE